MTDAGMETLTASAVQIGDLSDSIAAANRGGRVQRRADLEGILKTAVEDFLFACGSDGHVARAEGMSSYDSLVDEVRDRRRRRTAGAELLGQVLAAWYLRRCPVEEPKDWTWGLGRALGLDWCDPISLKKAPGDLRRHALAVIKDADDSDARRGWDVIYSNGTRTYATDSKLFVSVPDDLPAGTYRQNGRAGLIAVSVADVAIESVPSRSSNSDIVQAIVAEGISSFWTEQVPDFVERTLSGAGAEHTAVSQFESGDSAGGRGPAGYLADVVLYRKVYAAVRDLARLGQYVPEEVRHVAEADVFDVIVGHGHAGGIVYGTYSGRYLQAFLQLALDAAMALPLDSVLEVRQDHKAQSVKLSLVIDGRLTAALMNVIPDTVRRQCIIL